MAFKYCPNCKKSVETKFSGGQKFIMVILLLIGIVPRILYGIFHTRKCPVCGTRTTRKNQRLR